MKRYLLFAGNENTSGGWQDMIGDFDEVEEIRIAMHLEEDLTKKYAYGENIYLWYEIIDLTTGEVVKGRRKEA